MIKKLVNKLFLKQYRKISSASFREKKFVNYYQAKNILLIFESNYTEKNTKTKEIVQTLTSEGKKVTAIGFVDKRQITSAIYPDYRVTYPGDYSCFKKPSKSLLEYLNQNEYDLLIDISKEKRIELDYLVLYSNAKCKAGLKKSELNIYDLEIDLSSYLEQNETVIDDLEYSFLLNQILFYLKNIQTND
ncbi:hypothetical protein MASR2M117_08680 [Paludibacter sp.]